MTNVLIFSMLEGLMEGLLFKVMSTVARLPV